MLRFNIGKPAIQSKELRWVLSQVSVYIFGILFLL